jgi:hypothetical protein
MSKRIRPYGEEEKQYMREYYLRNREKILAQRKAEDVGHRREVRRERYKENKEVVLAKMKVYHAKNKEKVIQWHRKGNKTYSDKLKVQVVDAYGGRCACCGETEIAFLSVDHIHGGGNKHRRSLDKRYGFGGIYEWLRDQGFPKDEFRILCMNCQIATRYGRECPHQKVDIASVFRGIAY